VTTGDEADISRYQRYLAADPTNTLLLVTLGDMHHRAGRLEQALDCYQRCRAIDPDHAVASSRAAAVMITQHRFAEAEAALAPLAAATGDAALWHNLGLARYFQKRWPEAIEAFEHAREMGVDEVDNLRYLAHALHHTGDTARALTVADAWLQRAPDVATRGYVALLEMDHGDMAKAVERAEQVLAEAPDNTDAGIVVGMWSVEQQEVERARDEFTRISAAEPDNPRAWLGLALVHTYLQQHAAALAAYAKACELMPRNVGIVVAMAWEQYAAGDVRGAEARFRAAIEADRTFGEAHGGLAVMLVMQDRRDEARREIELARRLDVQGFGWVYAQSVLLALNDRRAEGEKLLARALDHSLRPGGPTLMSEIRTFLAQQARRAPPDDSPTRRLPR